MWLLLAWLILLPLAWALAGAPAIAALDWLDGSVVPQMLAHPAPLDSWQLGIAVALGVVLAVGPTRRVAMHLGTAVHEIGHGITAAALGGVISRITMAPDGSGQATTGLPGRARLRRSLVSLSGYLAPGIVGLASLRMALAGLGTAWLGYLTCVTLVMLLLTMRSLWAALVGVASAVAGWLLVSHAPGPLVTVVVAVLSGVLVARGVADAANQRRAVRAGTQTDAGSLARQTGLPVGLFSGLHQLLAVVMAGTAVWILLPTG
jgi:hypothetical protein